MKILIKSFVTVFFLSWCVSCESPTDSSNITLQTEFFLMNSAGAKTTSFDVGDDIHFHYSIKNLSPETQEYINPDTGPFVSLQVFKDDLLIGTSDDGFAYLAVIVEAELKGGETISKEYNWYSVDVHTILPPGEYTAKANPRLNFKDIPTPHPETIPFEIKCDSTSQACDTTNYVIITEQPPDSIQLDSFDLNSVLVDADTMTLNISYSGGCKDHEFNLFMSPAAFLESNPVQANLYLRHNSHGDACEAYLTEEATFNLRPIAELYQHFYGQKDEIILNVFDYFEEAPGDHIRVSYLPQ